jgi:hypothetical protein
MDEEERRYALGMWIDRFLRRFTSIVVASAPMYWLQQSSRKVQPVVLLKTGGRFKEARLLAQVSLRNRDLPSSLALGSTVS